MKYSSGAVVQGYLHPSEPLTPDAQKMNTKRAVHWPPKPVRASETLTESQHATAAGWREEDVGLREGAASSADKEYDTGCGPGCSKMHCYARSLTINHLKKRSRKSIGRPRGL